MGGWAKEGGPNSFLSVFLFLTSEDVPGRFHTLEIFNIFDNRVMSADNPQGHDRATYEGTFLSARTVMLIFELVVRDL